MPSMAQMAVLAQGAESEMAHAGIFAPFYGEREDIPTVSLADSFSSEGENILLRNGVAERFKGRLPEFVEAAFSIGTITASNGSATITASGGAGTFSGGANHKPHLVGRTITITDDGADNEYEVLSVSDAGDTLTLTTNYDQTGGAGLSYSLNTAVTKVPTPDGNPVKRYHRLLIGSSGTETEYFMAFTKAHVYLWSTSWTAWLLKFTCGSDCEQWDTVSFDNQVIATNNIDNIQVWGSTVANAFANLDHASGLDIGGATYLTKAKYLEVFENYVLLLYVTVDGTVYPYDLYWCSKDDETDWDQTGSGDAGSLKIQGAGPGRGLMAWGHRLIVGMEKKMKVYWLVTDSDVFNGDTIAELGCRAAHSMVIDGDDRLCWLASDYTIRSLPEGRSISQAKVKTLKNINAGLEEFIEAKWIEEYGQIWWSIPYGSDATENNKVLWYEPVMARWGELDVAISAFGEYTRQSVYTWGTWPFTTWGTIEWETWNGPQNVVGFPLDIGGDYSGHTYTLHGSELDDGGDYTGVIVFNTDLLERIVAKRLGVGLREYKRVEEIQVVAYAENAGSITIEIKRDSENAWQSMGTASLVNADREIAIIDLPDVDVRFRHAEIKVSGANRFRFVGIMLGFMKDGAR